MKRLKAEPKAFVWPKKNKSGLRELIIASACLPLITMGQTTLAQEAVQEHSMEEVVVLGTRKTIQDSISIKRDSTSVVEALSASDIGDIPALSVGEALETLTGASSHRDQGGATEISIRGLGPFLGSTVVNGREASNGSGDRSVNFSQFPSELINKLAIVKTQEASLVEGGVSGQIQLETLRPLDYGKQRLQMQLKGSINPDNQDLESELQNRGIGSRGTLSYVDQYDMGRAGSFGISLGAQQSRTTNPEQETRSTSGFATCRIDPDASSGVYASSDCNKSGGTLDLNADADGFAPDEGQRFLFVPSSRSFRQNITADDRDAIFAALQWQSNDERWDINLDMQASNRTFSEERNDLLFAQNRRIDAPGVPSRDAAFVSTLDLTRAGEIISFTNDQRVDINSQFQERIEEYRGGGLSIEFDATEKLKLSADMSYSDTSRKENILQSRLRNNTDLGNSKGRIETATVVSGTSSLVPLFSVRNFNVNDHDAYTDEARIRADLNQFRNNTITALRGDFEYLVEDSSFLESYQGGLRFSSLKFDSTPRTREELFLDTRVSSSRNITEEIADQNRATISAANKNCRNTNFPESSFLDSVSGDQNLITNFDNDGKVIAEGTGNSFATFDPLCLAGAFLGSSDPVSLIPEPKRSVENVEIKENTTAAYLQANYRSELVGLPVRGNIGVRIVNTDVSSIGLRGTLTAQRAGDLPGGNISNIVANEQDNGPLVEVEGGGRYTEILPSFNIVLDLNDTLLIRGGLYRGLSRPDPSDLGFGRRFSGFEETSEEEEIKDLSDLVGVSSTSRTSANGNPFLDPLTSVNFDAAIEWYPNDDSILAFGIYYKNFKGGFENSSRVEQFKVSDPNGPAGPNAEPELIDTIVTVPEVVSRSSNIRGFEVSAAHSFSYLPNILSGLGAKLSYNYADANFEFEDANFGDSTIISGSTRTQRIGIVPPANLFGFSDNVASAQLYYSIGNFDLQAIYKYRSEYFQQYISTPGNIRYIGDTEVYELRVKYKVNKNISLQIEGLNLGNEPRVQSNPTPNNVSEVNVYGPRIFAGVRMKF